MKSNKDRKFIQVIEKLELSHNEALIYYELIKVGSKGSTVYELFHQFNKSLKRTTIYSLLNKLIDLGCVYKKKISEFQKKPTTFIATKPDVYFNKIITQKQNELNDLQLLEEKYLVYLDTLYERGLEFSLDEVNEFVRPYLEPLVNNGWKITYYLVKKEQPIVEYTSYEILLQPPNFTYIKENSFHIYIFNFDIESDNEALSFFIKGLKMRTESMIKNVSETNDYEFRDIEFNFYDRTYSGVCLNVEAGTLQKLKIFYEISETSKVSNGNVDIWKAVIIPIKNRLFFLWSDSNETLKKLVDVIFLQERVLEGD